MTISSKTLNQFSSFPVSKKLIFNPFRKHNAGLIRSMITDLETKQDFCRNRTSLSLRGKEVRFADSPAMFYFWISGGKGMRALNKDLYYKYTHLCRLLKRVKHKQDQSLVARQAQDSPQKLEIWKYYVEKKHIIQTKKDNIQWSTIRQSLNVGMRA